MGFARFAGRRALGAALLVAGAVVLNFLLVHLAPGDPALMLAGEAGASSEATLREIRAEFGLDRPLAVQLGVYLARLGRADLGFSYFYRRPVLGLIGERIPATLLLVIPALALAAVAGVGFGVLAARRPRSLLSHALSVAWLLGYCMPVFWTSVMLLLLFAVKLPWFPAHGMATAGADTAGWASVLDVAHHLVLPVTALGLVYVALYSRLTRASMLGTLGSDYVRTARAKGLAEGRVLLVHALRNALLPVVTVAGLQLGQVLAGAILIETVFAWPGLGRLAFESILRRDYPLLLGTLLCSSAAVVAANFLTDLTYAWLDPRIRRG